jgi:hypothetical protein
MNVWLTVLIFMMVLMTTPDVPYFLQGAVSSSGQAAPRLSEAGVGVAGGPWLSDELLKCGARKHLMNSHARNYLLYTDEYKHYRTTLCAVIWRAKRLYYHIKFIFFILGRDKGMENYKQLYPKQVKFSRLVIKAKPCNYIRPNSS